MKVARSLAEITRDAGSVVTVGTFDGVHLAHQEIIREVVNRARMNEGYSLNGINSSLFLLTYRPCP